MAVKKYYENPENAGYQSLFPEAPSSYSPTNLDDIIRDITDTREGIISGTTPYKPIATPDFQTWKIETQPIPFTEPTPIEKTSFLGYESNYSNAFKGGGGGLKYVGDKLAQGVNYLSGAALSSVDNLWQLWSGSIVGNIVNPIIKAVGGQEINFNKTLTQSVTDVAKTAGATGFDVSQIKNQEMKNILNDINTGNNIMLGMTQRSSAVFNRKATEIKPTVSVVGQVLGDVAQSIPQTAVMALPHGSIMYLASSLSGQMNENVSTTSSQNQLNREMAYALWSADIDSASEMIFGLFGEASGFLRGALGKTIETSIEKAVKPTVGKLIASVALNSMEEGLEEMIAFPFQTFVDWRYNYPEKNINELVTWENAKKMGQAGLIGFISGGLFSVSQLSQIRNIKNQQKTDKLIEQAKDIMEMNVDDITIETAENFAENTMDVSRPYYEDVMDTYDALSPEDKAVLQTKTDTTANLVSTPPSVTVDAFQSKSDQTTQLTQQGIVRTSTAQETITPSFDEFQKAQNTVVAESTTTAVGQKAIPIDRTMSARIATKSLISEMRRGKDITKSIPDWIKSDEGKQTLGDVSDSVKVAEKITKLKGEIDSFISTNQTNNKGNFLKVNLQLLALKNILDDDSSFEVTPGTRSYLKNMIDYLNQNSSETIKREFSKEFKESDYFYEVFTDKKGLDKADERIIREGKEFQNSGGTNQQAWELLGEMSISGRIPTKDENIYLARYIERLYQNGDLDRAELIVNRIAKMATGAGQFSQSFKTIYNMSPEFQANHTIRELEKVINPSRSKSNRVEDEVKKTADVIRKSRKTAITGFLKKLSSTVDGAPSSTDMTLEKLFKRRVEKYINANPALSKEQSADSKLLSRLMAKARQTIGNDLIRRTPEQRDLNNYEILADMVKNRSRYAEVWDYARTELQGEQYEGMKKTYLLRFIEELADPVMAEKYMNSVIVANLRSMNIPLSQMAKDYFLKGDEVISNFTESLRKQMPNLDDDSFAYLKKHISERFAGEMVSRQGQDILSLKTQIERKSNIKDIMTTQEVIIDMLSKAAYYDAFNIDSIKTLWLKKMGVAEITDSMRDLIYKTMKDISRTTNEDRKSELYDTMVHQIADSVPSSLTEKVQAWLRTSMLLNLRTLIKNPLSNVLISPNFALAERMENKLLRTFDVGQENLIAGEKWLSVKSDSDISRKVLSYATDAHIRRSMAKTDKYKLGTILNQQKRIFKSKALESLTKLPFSIMSEGDFSLFKIKMFGDGYMYSKHYKHAMVNKLAALGYSESMTENAKSKLLEEADSFANEMAIERTFRNMTVLSTAIKGWSDGLAQHEKIKELEKRGDSRSLAQADRLRSVAKTAQFLTKIITPFVVTPAALASTAYRFSPLSLAKAVLVDYGYAKATGEWGRNAGQRALFAESFSKAFTGTATSTMIGFALAAFGLMDAGQPEDEKEKELWKLQGRKPYSIYLPGVGSVAVDWAAPLSIGLMMGAQIFKNVDESENLGQGLVGAVKAPIDIILKNTIAENLSSMFGAGYSRDTTFGDTMTNVLSSGLLQAMPSLLGQLAKVIDPVQRNAYSGSALNVMVNRFLQKVPFASMLIPAKVDIWGNELRQYKSSEPWNVVQRTFYNMISPFMKTEGQMDDTTREVARVYESTKAEVGGKALPSAVSGKIERTTKGVKTVYEVLGNDYVEYQKKSGQMAKTSIEKIMTSYNYAKMTDKQKALAFATAYSASHEKVADDYVKEYKKTHAESK